MELKLTILENFSRLRESRQHEIDVLKYSRQMQCRLNYSFLLHKQSILLSFSVGNMNTLTEKLILGFRRGSRTWR